MDGEMSSMDGEMSSMDGEVSSMDGEMSSMDGSVIYGCYPWMKTTDDGHGRSLSWYSVERKLIQLSLS